MFLYMYITALVVDSTKNTYQSTIVWKSDSGP